MNTNRWCEKEIEELKAEVSGANTLEAVESLFEIILTPREINDMAKRLKIKKLLEVGKSYQEIEVELRVSPAIISRISSHIGYGFRRSYARVGQDLPTPKPKYKRTITKYKGAVPIHRLFG